MNVVLERYAAAAMCELVAQFEVIPSQGIYGPVPDLLPSSPVRVVNIGAGTGRDAARLASEGHSALAVEPVRELREAGMAIHASTKVEWLDDRLPGLVETQLRGRFDLVVICADWQHLRDGERRHAVCSLARLAAPGGMMILSLRHRPGVPGRSAYPILPEATVTAALREGFTLVRRQEAESVQVGNRLAGVRWTWLALTLS